MNYVYDQKSQQIPIKLSRKRKFEIDNDEPEILPNKIIPPGVPLTCTIKRGLLGVKHYHPQDDDIFFDEKPHLYYVRDPKTNTFTNENVISVTKFYGLFTPKFDSRSKAESMSKKTSNAEYKDMTTDQILATFDHKRNLGSFTHHMAELFYNEEIQAMHEHIKKHKIETEYTFFQNYWKSESSFQIPYRTEMVLYSIEEKFILTGSADIFFVNKHAMRANDKLPEEEHVLYIDIYDIKRTEHFGSNRFYQKDMCLPPISHIPARKLYMYSLQTSAYKYMVEKKPNWRFNGRIYKTVKVSSMALLLIHPKNKNFIVYKCFDYTNQIKTCIDHYNKTH
jgi:hypothetical protein